MPLFALLVAVPIIEIALFIQVGGLIGLWPTLATVVITALLGTWLMRREGRGAMESLQRRLAEGGDPTGPIAHGAMILVAGVLLLTPGFFTDACGLALLLPPVRAALIRWGAAKLAAGVRSGNVFVMTSGGGMGGAAGRPGFDGGFGPGFGAGPRPGGPGMAGDPRGGDVVEGRYETVDDAPGAETAPGSDGRIEGPKGSGWTRRP